MKVARERGTVDVKRECCGQGDVVESARMVNFGRGESWRSGGGFAGVAGHFPYVLSYQCGNSGECFLRGVGSLGDQRHRPLR